MSGKIITRVRARQQTAKAYRDALEGWERRWARAERRLQECGAWQIIDPAPPKPWWKFW